MKTSLAHYIQLIRDNYNGGPWYGDSLLEKLVTLDAKEAFATPAPGMHSIAQQVAHILAWRQLLIERIKGNDDFKIQDNSARDWPSQDTLQTKGWKNLLSDLETNQTALLQILEAETDALLARLLPDGKRPMSWLLDGVVLHDIYHLGQIGQTIALLKASR